MKHSLQKILTGLFIFTLLLLPFNEAFAGGRGHRDYRGHSRHNRHSYSSGWNDLAAAAIGVAGFSILYSALNQPTYSRTSYYVGSPAVNYSTTYAQPVYNAAPPVIYTPAPSRIWVPGYYVENPETIWIPNSYKNNWVPPVYDWVWSDCGKRYVKIREGYYAQVLVPGYYATRTVRQWVPGYWQYN